MGWSLDEFNQCFWHGMILRVRKIDADGSCLGYRLRKKKWTYFEEGELLRWKIGLKPEDGFECLLAGDLCFRNAKDMEVSLLRPGVNMPPIEVREKKMPK